MSKHSKAIRTLNDSVNNIQNRIIEIEEGYFNDRFSLGKIEKLKERLMKDELELQGSIKVLLEVSE